MTFSLRLATAGQLFDIRTLLFNSLSPIGNRMGIKTPAEAFSEVGAQIDNRDVYLLSEDDTIRAVAVLHEDDDALYIDFLAVDPKQQNKGLGSRLLADIEMIAESRELYCLRLRTPEVMEELLRFYQSRGFAETHRSLPNHGRDKVPRVHFSKKLVRHGLVSDMAHEHDRVLA